MNWFSTHHLVLIFLLALSPVLQVVDGLRDSLKCPVRILKGGRVRIRSKGRVAKYVCLRGSQVLGDKYSTCVRGKWDSPVPICINSGCLAIDVLNGQVLETYRGAVVTVHCDPGYTLLGSQSLYCNGAVWNDTAPTCKEIQVKAQKWCDFESEDLCGWTHDLNHDFDWRRHNFATPSGHVGTGPSFDHTLGPGLNGHYMYLEVSSPRLQNDTARLFSPVFNTPSAFGSCFIFWYHMFGTTTGTLNVYLHKQDTSLLFSKSGDQGNQWLQAVLPLPQINSSFQIVMEGVRGAGYEGDIAIDDVKLAEGQECSVVASISPSSEEVTSTVEMNSSCENRCLNTATDPSWCECTPDCIGNNTCCLDYMLKCSTGVSEARNGSGVTTVKLSTPPPVTVTSSVLPNITVTSTLAPPNNSSVTYIPSYYSTSNKSQSVGVYQSNVSVLFNTIPSLNESYKSIAVQLSTTTQSPKSVSSHTTNQAATKQATTSLLKVPTNKAINQSVITTTIFKITTPMLVPVPTIPSLNTTSQLSVFPTKIIKLPTKLSTKQTTVRFPWNPQRSTSTKTPQKSTWTPQKPKIEFVTPPPPIIFRKPAKTFWPFTKPVHNNSTINIQTTTTTQNQKKVYYKTEKPPKSKNDVFHPVWFNDLSTTSRLPPLSPKPGTLTNKTAMYATSLTTTQPPTTLYISPINTTMAETKWKSKYKTRDETPVHAQYAVPSSPSGQIVHITLLVSGVLLVLVTSLATACVLRRRKINRRRMEDDELDIQFLASDEILDFTLARPSLEDIQMNERRR